MGEQNCEDENCFLIMRQSCHIRGFVRNCRTRSMERECRINKRTIEAVSCLNAASLQVSVELLILEVQSNPPIAMLNVMKIIVMTFSCWRC